MKVFKFATGLAVGYVLGSRAGRERYEQIVAAARKAQDHPTVTQIQQKAKGLLGTAQTADTSDAGAPASVTASTSAPRPPRRQPTTTPNTLIEPLP
ncbi:hypothetical protein [Actinoplanes friuliensis]|uniref:YtxH domain-containing protein n=1 Tax=Actinoplanes friuliensis DSM 7358 TaxID=1246995 RepID=U5VNE1_9ACTN|nr:hypothetical protein [Actinoplanes friuliensis]AGZ38488.1 hypothetical protein AFR_00995 [Actinoplanes friuliensis DSM 7358]